MRPELFNIPFLDWPIRSFGLMIVIGFLIAIWLAAREVRRRGLPDLTYDLGVAMLMCGLVGARVFFYWEFYDEQFKDLPWYYIFYIWKGGMVFYGSAIGGAIGGYAYLRYKRVGLQLAGDFMDCLAPYIPIGMAFGRFGCFLNGCCYGGRCSTSFPLGVQYPVGTDGLDPAALALHRGLGWVGQNATESLPVYPVPLLEAGLDFLLFGLLWWYLRGQSHGGGAPRGGGLPLLFVLYGVERFGTEMLRGDNKPYWLNLTISQEVSIVLIVIFLPLFVFLWVREKGRIQTLHSS